MRQLIITTVLLVLGVIASRIIFSSLYQPTKTVASALTFIVGAAMALGFYYTWAKTGLDPVQWTICQFSGNSPACMQQRTSESAERFLNPEPTGPKTDLQQVQGTTGCGFPSFVLGRKEEKCGFRLGAMGELSFNGRVVSSKLVVTVSSADQTTAPWDVVIYPEPKFQRFFLIQGCDDYHCWALWKFDHKHWTLTPAYAGKYGPERWIEWSADGSTAIMYNSLEGVSWLYALNFAQQNADGKSMELLSVDPASFQWESEQRFRVLVKLHNETKSKPRSFRLNNKTVHLLN